MRLNLGKRWSSDGKRCLIIGEVAQSHDGSLGMAHAFIDAIADAGAGAVKFQAHIAQAESTRGEPWRIKFSVQDMTRYDYWRRMEFTEEQWRGLARHAASRNLLFLCSPFSVEAVEMLLRVGVPAWKVASGEVDDIPLLEKMIKTRLPILFSTGMSSLREISRMVSLFRSARLPHALLQCTSVYPSPPEMVGANLIKLYRKQFACPVGLSDHSGTIFPALVAAWEGASLIEVHVTMSREMFGPDVSSSITTSELKQLVNGVRFIEKMRSNPVDKDKLARKTAGTRRIFSKSLVVRIPLRAGTVLDRWNLSSKKPGTGIPASELDRVIGKKLLRDVGPDHILTDRDIEK